MIVRGCGVCVVIVYNQYCSMQIVYCFIDCEVVLICTFLESSSDPHGINMVYGKFKGIWYPSIPLQRILLELRYRYA